jgi:transcriptional regulator with XRE-family HTH domain
MDQKLDWKLRRVAACIRQQDVARRAGLTLARYGGIERGEIEPRAEERRSIEAALPPLPPLPTTDAQPSERTSASDTGLKKSPSRGERLFRPFRMVSNDKQPPEERGIT